MTPILLFEYILAVGGGIAIVAVVALIIVGTIKE